MNIHDFLEPLIQYHSYFSWRNVLEVTFFCMVVYYFSLWLKKDVQKNLLGYFFSYCLLTIGASLMELDTIVHFLMLATPVGLMLFIVFHQFTLQKNFVTLRNLVPAQHHNADWLETLVRSCLIAISTNKEVICIIEHHDSLQEHLNTPLPLHIPVSKEMLDILFSSSSFASTHMLWINSQGIVRGINARWHESHGSWTSDLVPADQQWKHDAILHTEKTDALVLKITRTNNAFEVVASGTLFENVSAAKTIAFVAKYLRTSSIDAKGDFIHEKNNEKNHQQRPS